MTLRSVAIGCGAYLPEKILHNDDLSRQLKTSDEWIAQRTGIRQRHIAAEGELTLFECFKIFFGLAIRSLTISRFSAYLKSF